ncbi:MAG: hypothetical protein ABIA63_14835 [bacterium]
MQELFNKIQQGDLTDFKGLALNGSIPVKQEIINQYLKESVVNGDNSITEMHIDIDNLQIRLHLTVVKWVISKSFSFVLVMEQREFSRDTPEIIVAFKELPNFFILNVIQSFVSGFDFIRFENQKVAINLKTLLGKLKAGRFLALIKKAELRQDNKKLFVDFTAMVD